MGSLQAVFGFLSPLYNKLYAAVSQIGFVAPFTMYKNCFVVVVFSVQLVFFHEFLLDSGLEPWCCLPCGFRLLPSHDSHRAIHPDLFEVIDQNCSFMLFLCLASLDHCFIHSDIFEVTM